MRYIDKNIEELENLLIGALIDRDKRVQKIEREMVKDLQYHFPADRKLFKMREDICKEIRQEFKENFQIVPRKNIRLHIILSDKGGVIKNEEGEKNEHRRLSND